MSARCPWLLSQGCGGVGEAAWGRGTAQPERLRGWEVDQPWPCGPSPSTGMCSHVWSAPCPAMVCSHQECYRMSDKNRCSLSCAFVSPLLPGIPQGVCSEEQESERISASYVGLQPGSGSLWVCVPTVFIRGCSAPHEGASAPSQMTCWGCHCCSPRGGHETSLKQRLGPASKPLVNACDIPLLPSPECTQWNNSIYFALLMWK